MKAKPKFKISQAQFALFLQLWQAACKAQGWDKISHAFREEARHQILSECGFASLKDVTPKDGFDKVKRRLQELADIIDTSDGQRTRDLHAVGELVPQALEQKGEPWLQTLLKDRFKLFEGYRGITDLGDRDLRLLVITLRERLKA